MTDVRSRIPDASTARPVQRSARRGDGALVDAIACGDQAALAEAYAQHASRVHAVARVVCGHARAEDLTQEIFLRLWNAPHRFDAGRGSLRTYLLMQAHSRAVDVLRRDDARAARETAEELRQRMPEPGADAAALALLERTEVTDFVTSLPTVEREAIVLAYFGGHSYREVARLLDIPEGTVKTRIRSGLRRLRADRAAALDLTEDPGGAVGQPSPSRRSRIAAASARK